MCRQGKLGFPRERRHEGKGLRPQLTHSCLYLLLAALKGKGKPSWDDLIMDPSPNTTETAVKNAIKAGALVQKPASAARSSGGMSADTLARRAWLSARLIAGKRLFFSHGEE